MEELYEALESLGDGAGEFACSGLLPELGYPGLYVENVGYISLPVHEEQAQKIIEVAKKAPYGMGTQTLVDETVRKTWQLDPNQITIKNKNFIAGVGNVVSTVKKHLGCDTKTVQAGLYKILLYEKGGHFKPHRDTEKENGMFATMIIQLPSQFEGGKLSVRHAGKEKVVNFDGEESVFCCKYAALYADCEHEVSEVKSGYRLALVYSLCWTETSDPPSADTGAAILQNIAQLIDNVFDSEERRLFLWFFSHKYTVSGLSHLGINALKGADDAVARALLLANERLSKEKQLEFHIVEVTRQIFQFGYIDEYGSGKFEAETDGEEQVNIETWYKFDGSERRMGKIHFDLEEDVVNFCCPSDLTHEEYVEEFWGEAYNEEYSGPTGNAGATQTSWYRSYAIIAWPKVQSLHIICKSGYGAAVEYVFDQLNVVQNLTISDPSYQSALKDLKAVVDFGISHCVSLHGNAGSTMLKTFAMLRPECPETAKLANLFLLKVMAKTSGSQYTCCLASDELVRPLAKLTITLGWSSISESIKTMYKMSPVSQHSRWAEFLKTLYKKDAQVLREDVLFKFIVACLVEKLETEVQDNQLQSVDADARVQSIASLLFLLSDAELLKKFSAAICSHSHHSPKSSLLQKLIQSLEKRKLDDGQFWMQLLVRRIHQLEEIEKLGIRPFTWNQEEAVVAGHPQVQAFLRGPSRRMRYEAFEGIGHARNWTAKHFDRKPLASHSATVTVGGRGRDAYAVIEKTREWYDRKVNTIKQQLSELEKLRGLVKPLPVATTGCSSSDQLEPQAKKRAVDLVCIDDD